LVQMGSKRVGNQNLKKEATDIQHVLRKF